MKAKLVAFLVVTLAAVVAVGSNMGFLTRYVVQFDPEKINLYWISLPHFYNPPDVNKNGIVDAEDLGQDLQPRGPGYVRPCGPGECVVYEVWRWDPENAKYEIWRVGSSFGEPFQIKPGESYGLNIQEVGGNRSHVLEIAGANDPTFKYQFCVDTSAVSIAWVALPHNLALNDVNHNGRLDAEDLGQAMGGPAWIYQVRHYDPATGHFQVWRVGSSFGEPFEINPSEGYVLDFTCPHKGGGCVNPSKDPCTWTWEPPHY